MARLPPNISRRLFLVGTTSVAASLWNRSASADGKIVVIVNASNRETPSQADLAAIFTTRRQTWKDGDRIVPFNYPARHDVRVAFDRAILDMDPDEVARYWIDRRIRGGNPPPKQVSSGALIARLVEKMPGAIGYVPSDLVRSGVRVVARV